MLWIQLSSTPMQILGFAIALALIIVISALRREKEQKTRRKADLIKQRLAEPPQVRYRHVEIRLGNRS